METILDKYCCRRFIEGRTTTLWIIAINMAVFLSLWIAETISHNHSPSLYLALPAEWHEVLARPWTLLTYMVTHQSFLHLIFNMLWLLWFGTMSEHTVGSRSLVMAYICGGLVGGMIYVAAGSLSNFIPFGSSLIGASASVLCIMTATALRSPNLEVSLLAVGHIRLKWFALLCILLALFGLGGGNSGGVVAHLGGIITGTLIALRQSSTMRQLKFKTRLRLNRHKVRQIRVAAEASSATQESHEQRLNTLLDKIKVSGYASLTSSERTELTRLSKKI